MINNEQEIEKEFGEFGEIAVKNCFICSKTIRQRNCYGFVREKDKPKFTPTTQPQGYAITSPKSYVCLKCLLKGLYSICKSKEDIDKFLDLYIKTAIVDNIDAQLNKQEDKK